MGQVVTPIRLAEIQKADIPRPGGQGGVYERRLIISFAEHDGAQSYTVVFPSSRWVLVLDVDRLRVSNCSLPVTQSSRTIYNSV